MALLDRLFRASAPVAIPEQKAVTGSGAFAMQYDMPISSGRWDTPKGMKAAEALSHSNPWMDKAERLVSGRAAGMAWHLETPDGETVDDEAPPQLRAVRDLLEGGTDGRQTWRQRAGHTYRHMGVVNVGAWYLDAIDANKIPAEILYLNPARLTPYQPSGVLEAWLLDADEDYGNTARRLELDEVMLFVLDPPDWGYFGRGLVEVADGKAALNRAVDRYATQTFASGGRKGSWIMPKEGRLPDDVYEGLVASMKNVRESYDSAKRDIVSKAPLDVVAQAATAQELQAVDIMRLSREDILLIWNIDLADAGIPGGAGLSSGDMRQQARQSTYENAIDPRVDVFTETIQLRFLDRWKALGIELQLVIDRPTWDDEKAVFERAQLALPLPLRNRERREMIGLDPIGDPLLDEAVWLPLGYSEAYLAPDVDGRPVAPPPTVVVEPVVTPQLEAGTPVKASVVGASPLGRTRAHVDKTVVPRMQKSVAEILDDQKAEVLRLIREKAAHLAAKPGDARAIWNDKTWDAAMERAIGNYSHTVTQTVAGEAQKMLAQPGAAQGVRHAHKAEPVQHAENASLVVPEPVQQADLMAWATTNAENAGRALETVTALELAKSNMAQTVTALELVESNKAQTDDIANALEMIAEAMSRSMPAPVVNVPAPVVNVPAPVVNVSPPDVTVNAPKIDVKPMTEGLVVLGDRLEGSLRQKSTTKYVKRDYNGRIESVREVVDE